MRQLSGIAVVNQCSLDRDVILRIVEAVGRQLVEHVAPAWGRIAPEVVFHDRLSTVPSGVPPIVLFDNAWCANLSGYHSETPDGRSFARVFLDSTLADGGVVLHDGPRTTVASVVSHEAIEMFIDPDCNVWVDGPPIPQGRSYALEICDPVNRDVYPVTTGDGTIVGVSNFVYPDWYDPQAAAGARFDHRGCLRRPFSVRAPGYSLVRWWPGTEVMVGAPVLPSGRWLSSIQFPASRTMRRVTHRAVRHRKRRAASR
jgi:hypothetical protein